MKMRIHSGEEYHPTISNLLRSMKFPHISFSIVSFPSISFSLLSFPSPLLLCFPSLSFPFLLLFFFAFLLLFSSSSFLSFSLLSFSLLSSIFLSFVLSFDRVPPTNIFQLFLSSLLYSIFYSHFDFYLIIII